MLNLKTLSNLNRLQRHAAIKKPPPIVPLPRRRYRTDGGSRLFAPRSRGQDQRRDSTFTRLLSVKNKPLEEHCIGRPEANIVVPVIGSVIVAVGDAAVVRVVVPRAAAYDAVGAVTVDPFLYAGSPFRR